MLNKKDLAKKKEKVLIKENQFFLFSSFVHPLICKWRDLSPAHPVIPYQRIFLVLFLYSTTFSSSVPMKHADSAETPSNTESIFQTVVIDTNSKKRHSD